MPDVQVTVDSTPIVVTVDQPTVAVTVTGPPGLPGPPGTGGGGSAIAGEVWVAAASGSANTDTANIRAAVLASRGGSGALGSTGMSGGTIRFPAGLYLINDTILFDQYSGIISGNGSGSNDSVGVNGFTGQATVIRWADGAPTDRAMFKFTDYERILFSDIRLEGNDTNPPMYGIQSEWIASRDGNVGGTFLTLERLKVGAWRYPSPAGGWSRSMQTGIAFNGENGNNDQFAFKSLQVMGCTYRGISIENTQSIWGTIHDLVVQRCWGDAALYLSSSTTIVNYTCDLNHTDLKVDHGANVIIFGWWSERCKQNYWDVKSSSMLTVIGGKLQLNDTANASGSGPETMLGKPYMNAQSNSAVQMTFKDVSFWYGTSAMASAPPKLYWRGTNDNPTGGQAFLDGHRPTLTLIGNKGLTLDALDVQCTASSPDRAYVNLALDGGETIQTTITNKPIRTYIDPQVKTASYTLKDGEVAPLLMNSASATTVTLPDAALCRKGITRFTIFNVNTGTVTIKATAGLVNGVPAATGVTLAPWQRADVETDGVQWLAGLSGGGGAAATDHGALTGLADDDHPQYHTDARGDARYSQAGHNHAGVYDPAGTATSAVSAHAALADPHIGYLKPTDVVAGTNVTLTATADTVTINAAGGGHTVQDEGTPLAARAGLNFVGAGVAVTDDSAGNRTVVTVAGGGGVTDHGALTGLGDDDHPQYVGRTGAQTLDGPVVVDSAGTAAIALDRGAGTSYAHFEYRTAGVQKWTLGTRNGEGENLTLYNNVTDQRPLLVDATTDLVTLRGDPTAALGAATRQYVDNRAPKTTVSSTAPSSPAVGDVWIDTT